MWFQIFNSTFRCSIGTRLRAWHNALHRSCGFSAFILGSKYKLSICYLIAFSYDTRNRFLVSSQVFQCNSSTHRVCWIHSHTRSISFFVRAAKVASMVHWKGQEKNSSNKSNTKVGFICKFDISIFLALYRKRHRRISQQDDLRLCRENKMSLWHSVNHRLKPHKRNTSN